ncbi:hypothetical protein BDN72DRAFT_849504 [Pluteus cervinus]|uniref:Uncharacterized protein n=1 Tax=Pluteus cervinus TaxID=181527 RepID=A0ACD3A7J7_9AGAR|nr:hypothetical protein BDN72DRAFT_849504 [Pluteus cervinus]
MGVEDAAAVLPAFAILPFSPMNAIRFSGGWFEDHHPGIFDYFNAQGTIQRLELAAEFVPTFIRYIQPQNSRLREIANLVGIDDRNRLLLDHQTAVLGLTLREWLVWRNIFGVRLGSLVLVNLNVPCGTTDWFEG